MVKHDIIVRGLDLGGNEHKPPVLLQMNDDDFPARFLQDLASQATPPISSTAVINVGAQPLYQPVQRMLNLALIDLKCNSLSYPRVDPTRILSAGLVIRRVYRNPGTATEDWGTLQAWMRNPTGQYKWIKLAPGQENLDPDPTQRPQLSSGQAELDRQLANLYLSTANTESTTPGFAAPPATCAALGRTIVYAVIPTASSEVSDTPTNNPPLQIDPVGLLGSLPGLLSAPSAVGSPAVPLPGQIIDYRWMTDDFLNSVYPPIAPAPPPPPSSPPLPPTLTPTATPDPRIAPFHQFTTALRMLHTVFGAFDGTPGGNAILQILNRHYVTFADGSTEPMGAFYQSAKVALIDDTPVYPSASAASTASQLLMPTSWDWLNGQDQSDLIAALTAALPPSRAQNVLAPQGRFQDSTRYYQLRMFFRIKGDKPSCPPELVWSRYSEPFQIAPWHATGDRSHPPIPLPGAIQLWPSCRARKPNCSLSGAGQSDEAAMQGTTLSGLMNGAGGGGGLSLGWICGFNIPLITICAFFVLNIFLSLLNIVFFWLPFIKICIPIPVQSDD